MSRELTECYDYPKMQKNCLAEFAFLSWQCSWIFIDKKKTVARSRRFILSSTDCIEYAGTSRGHPYSICSTILICESIIICQNVQFDAIAWELQSYSTSKPSPNKVSQQRTATVKYYTVYRSLLPATCKTHTNVWAQSLYPHQFGLFVF